jgi:hypothetical protein
MTGMRMNTPDDPNTVGPEFFNWSSTKSFESKAIENYLYISKTYHYLKSKNYKFVFLNFLDPNFPSRSGNFDISTYLPKQAQKKLAHMMDKVPDLYSISLKNDHLFEDDFHPTTLGHMQYTKNILIPYLKTKFC